MSSPFQDGFESSEVAGNPLGVVQEYGHAWRSKRENTTSLPSPLANTRIGLCIAVPCSVTRLWSTIPKVFRSVKRTVIGPFGVSAIQSNALTRRNEWPSPDAHVGRFSGSARKAYTSSMGCRMETLIFSHGIHEHFYPWSVRW